MSDDVLQALLDKRADLLARMAGISAAPVDSGDISFGKRVGDGTSIAVERLTQVAAHEQMLGQLAEVERALAKLDEGSYGTCDSCGGEIPPGRLEVHPWAVRCVTCAAQG
ncbi:MAG: TraR/DksA C4-type zinc finger protein [Actinomycetales bacterium]|nr:TraR/DksA C4-type zinc finger protein [Actinomycetales bacterium]